MVNQSPTHSHRAPLLLSPEQLAELAVVIRGPAPEGELWIGRTVAVWMAAKLRRPVSVQLGWAYLVRLDGKRRKPRPRHVKADAAAQAEFKKTASAGSGSRDRLPCGPGRTVDHRMSTASGSSRFCRRPGASTESGRLPRFSIATTGDTSSALSTPPRVEPFSISPLV